MMRSSANRDFSSTWCNLLDFGAVGDGRTTATRALQEAIDACHARGGGTLLVPAGKYLTGPITFQDDISLYLDAGATLLASQDPADYPVTSNRWEGREQPAYAPLIGGNGLKNVALLGRGTIDGQGEAWWKSFRENRLAAPRPRLIGFADCSNLLIQGVRLINSPGWTVNPVRCENVQIHGLTIVNPPDSPNTDGINPDSCRHVRISDCYVSAGDDCIAIKSGAESEERALLAASRDITISNCTLARGHGGIVIGSEMSGGVQNVVVSNCVFVGTDRGIRMKSRRGRGGVVEDIRISNLVMTDVLCPFTINLYYHCGAKGDPTVSDKLPRPVDAGTPRFRRIHLSHVTARNVKHAAGFLYGLAEMPVEDISLEDVSISLSAGTQAGYPDMADGIELMRQAGFFVRNARGLRCDHLEIDGQLGPAILVEDSSLVEIDGGGTSTPRSDAPVIRFSNVREAVVRNCRAAAGTDVFLELAGAGTRSIALIGNALDPASLPVRSAVDVPEGEIQIR
jgi:polygalacturonase